MEPQLFIGLMSGTSVDAIDTAVVSIQNGETTLVHCREHAIPEDLRQQISAISHPGENEIERMGRLDRELGRLFAEATLELLHSAGINQQAITAIGSHGQTIRHRPPSGGDPVNGFSLQIGDANTIAEITGITTVADFRRRDIAAGGEGAPLAPAFHACAFAKSGCNRAIVNIGGIANTSLLQGLELVAGFDTGPGNTLLDNWIARHKNQRYDHNGDWAAGGILNQALLDELLNHSYLKRSGPRSTGKEAFNLAWLDSLLVQHPELNSQDTQATLAQFTALTIASAVHNDSFAAREVYICGGGAHNADLMRRLTRALPKGTMVDSTQVLGVAADWVEAVIFAWLAHRTVAGLSGNAEAATGACGTRVLGAIYQGKD